MDYTTETPEAALTDVVQLMWVHIEEPDPDGEVLDSSGSHIWYRVALRDMSCSVLVVEDHSAPGGSRGVLVEKMLDTESFRWTKWNDNAGRPEWTFDWLLLC